MRGHLIILEWKRPWAWACPMTLTLSVPPGNFVPHLCWASLYECRCYPGMHVTYGCSLNMTLSWHIALYWFTVTVETVWWWHGPQGAQNQNIPKSGLEGTEWAWPICSSPEGHYHRHHQLTAAGRLSNHRNLSQGIRSTAHHRVSKGWIISSIVIT